MQPQIESVEKRLCEVRAREILENSEIRFPKEILGKKKIYIAFEGPTLAGKTTYAKYLAKLLKKITTKYVKLSPSNNIIGKTIKKLTGHLPYLVEDFFYLIDNFIELMYTFLSNAEIIIYDKSPFNLLAFWKTFRSGRYTSILEKLASSLYSNFQPDITFYLEADYEERRKRLNKKIPRSKMDEFLIQLPIDKKLRNYLYYYVKMYTKSEIKYINTTNGNIEKIGNYLLHSIFEVVDKKWGKYTWL